MASRFICQLQRFLRFSLLVACVALGMSYAFRAIGADFEFYLAKNVAESREQALWHLSRARKLYPYDHNIRSATAYFYTAFSLYDMRLAAIDELETELRVNPFAIDLWLALAAYKNANKDADGTKRALAHIEELRPGLIVGEPAQK